MAASCDADLRELVSNQIDGSIDIEGSGCDGNYLVLNLAHRTCASDTSPSSCLGNLGLAFFVAQNGHWTLITYGQQDTCASIAAEFGYRDLPGALCSQALAS